MKKITFILGMLSCLLVHGQRLNWTNATPYGISVNAATNAWHSGRAMDVVDYRDGSVLVGSEMGGVWWANQNGEAACLTDDLDDPNINAIERGPDGEHHIYFATNAKLWESRSPRLAPRVQIPLPMGATFVKDIAILNGARRIIVGCNNGVFWSEIPSYLDPMAYRWRRAVGTGNEAAVFSLSAKSTGGAWQAAETITEDRVGTRKLAVVSRCPIARDIFWIGADRSLRTAWNVKTGNWQGQTFSITAANSANPNSDLAAVSQHETQIDVFFAGPDGKLNTAWWNAASGGWNSRVVRDDAIVGDGSPIQAVSRYDGSLDVFYLSPSRNLMHVNWEQGRDWDAPVLVSGSETVADGSNISVVSRRRNLLNVFWISPNGTIKTNWWDQWSGHRTWDHLFTVPVLGTASPQAGIVAVARDPEKLDLAWVSSRGELMSTYWNQNLPDQWDNHSFALTAPNIASTSNKIAMVSRHPLQLDLFWKGTDGNVHTNWWYAYSQSTWSGQTYSLGSIGNIDAQDLFAGSAFDDELSVYVVSSTGKLSCQRWVADNGDILVGYAGGQAGGVRVGRFENGELQLSATTLLGGDGVYGTTVVSQSKYGTACYAAISASMINTIERIVPDNLRYVFKTTNLRGPWNQTAYEASGNPTWPGPLQNALGLSGRDRNIAIAASPVDNEVVQIGFVTLYETRNGGANWRFVGSDHVHPDIARVSYGYYDRSGKTAYHCTDGGLSGTTDGGAAFFSGYNRGLATLQCYTTDGIRQSDGTLGVNSQVEGLIGAGLQDNGSAWTILGSGRWDKIFGGDGGYFEFLGTGQAVFRNGISSSRPFRRGDWDGTLTDQGILPVCDNPQGITSVNGGFTSVNRIQTSGPLGAAVQGYGWENRNIYSLWNATGILGWRFQLETTALLAVDGSITAGASINGDLLVFGTSSGKIAEFDRLARTVTLKNVEWARGMSSIQDYGVTKIVMTAYDAGYAVFSRFGNRGDFNSPSYIFKYDGNRWRQLTFADPSLALPAQRIFGLTVSGTAANSTVVLCTDSKIYMSRDGGTSWADQSTGLPTRAHLADVRFVSWPTSGRKFLVSTFGRGVWITDAP